MRGRKAGSQDGYQRWLKVTSCLQQRPELLPTLGSHSPNVVIVSDALNTTENGIRNYAGPSGSFQKSGALIQTPKQ